MAVKKPKGQYTKGGGKGLAGDALVGTVSQSTIDDIKRLGMTKALELAGKNGSTAGGSAREFQEGVRRMYGAQRLAAAKTKFSTPAPQKKSGPLSANTPAVRKPATSGLQNANRPAYSKNTPTKSAPASKPKSASTASKVAAAAGTAAAIGALVATRGKGVGIASKLAPGIAKSGIGKALVGKGEVFVTKAASTSGRVAAKAGKPVSQTQYEAMQAAAKAKGVKAPVKAAATKSSPAAKAITTKKVAAAGAATTATKKKK